MIDSLVSPLFNLEFRSFLSLFLTHTITHLSIILLGLIILLDFLYYRIPNKLTFGLLLLFPLIILCSGNYEAIFDIWIMVISLIICFGLFGANLIGGGDAKLIPVLCLWAGKAGVLTFLFWGTLCAGGIGFFYLIAPRSVYFCTSNMRHFIYHNGMMSSVAKRFIPDLDKVEGNVFFRLQVYISISRVKLI